MKSANPPTVSRVIVKRLVTGLEMLGVDPAPALARCGLSPATVTTLPERVRYDLVSRLFTAAIETSHDGALGVRLAELVEPEFYELFGYAVKSSATVGEALALGERYLGLLTDAFSFSLHADGERTLCLCRTAFPKVTHPGAVEFVLGAVVVIGRHVTGRDLTPLEVRFTHAAPPDPTHHRRVFGASLVFESLHDGLVFPASLLEVPTRSGDRRLCRLLEHQAEQLLASLPQAGRYARRVQTLLAADLRADGAAATRVAKQLGMHHRTLSRRLREEGTSLRKLIDAVRCDFAGRYLATSDLSIAEVADRLGFSDPTAFIKAFRRWTDDTPQAFRRRARRASSAA